MFKFKTQTLKKEGLYAEGIGSSNSLDKQGEKILITPNALKRALPDFFVKGSPVLVEHGFTDYYGRKKVGKVIEFDYEPKDYDIDTPMLKPMKIKVKVLIDDPDAIRDIMEGRLREFSLGWENKVVLYSNVDPTYEESRDIIINELSLCYKGANPDAKIEMVSDHKKEFIYKNGQLIEVFGSPAKVKSCVTKDDDNYYEVSFSDRKIKTALIPESTIVKQKTSFEEERDEAFSKYQDATNMGYQELLQWSKNPLSRKASIGREAIRRNLRLKKKDKDQWTRKDVRDANKAVSYLARAKQITGDNNVTIDGKDSGYTKNEIALKNWAYNSRK